MKDNTKTTAAITTSDLMTAQEAFKADHAALIAHNAVTSVGLRKAARVPEAIAAHALGFDHEVKQGERTNQEHSGRCWMFASENILRQHAIARYDLKTFELSECYPLFFDKLEKSNWFLVNILDTVEEPLESRLMAFLLRDPVGDGGQWDMFRALVKKYGVVPKEAMPETACSKNTREMDKYLTRYLRACAMRLRACAARGSTAKDLDAMREDMMVQVWRFLAICLGMPPTKFESRVRDKNNKLVEALSGTFTPKSFYDAAIGMELDDYVSLVSAPTLDKPFNRTYTVERLGNVIEGGGVLYLNLPIERLKEVALAQLRDNVPVWFGCDVDQSFLRVEGIMDTAAIDIDMLLGLPVESAVDRATRLDYGESTMTHAMVFEGVRLDGDGHPALWKVENSWGENHGRKGFDTLSDAWFNEYVYQVVVDKKYLTDLELAALQSEPLVLAPWDPLGSLA